MYVFKQTLTILTCYILFSYLFIRQVHVYIKKAFSLKNAITIFVLFYDKKILLIVYVVASKIPQSFSGKVIMICKHTQITMTDNILFFN